MMCEYCEKQETIIYYDGFDVGIIGNELFLSSYYDSLFSGAYEKSVKINFCPMCGRKLRDD